MDSMAIYALQKLWRVYYYASTYPFSEFSLANNTALNVDPAHFELLLLNCFSTSQLKIISDGSECDRNDKTRFIADYSIARKNLHVCLSKPNFNCGVCSKCLRTLLAIDALNKLDDFRDSFNIDEYLRNRINNYLYLFQKYVLEKDTWFEKTFKILYNRHPKFFDSIVIKKS